MKADKRVNPVSKRNAEYVKSIKEFCDKKGAKFILLSTPSTKNWNSQRHNGIVQLAEELGVEYIDMNTESADVGIDWSRDTRDKGNHLNFYGAVKVTDWLGNYFKESGLLEDHRGNESYAEAWNGDIEYFRQAVNIDLATFES